MGSPLGIRVEGGPQLRATLRRAGADLDALKAAHAAAGRLLVGPARRLVPVDKGTLQGTIRVGASRRAAILRAGYASVPYAGLIHYGWPKENIRPSPFLWDAFKAVESRVIDVYTADVQKILDKIKGL